MRQLKSFKDIHKDEDIYVLASGKSIDFLDQSFFDDKIVIGVNQVYRWRECQYLLRKECMMIDQVLEESPNSIHFISIGNCGGGNMTNLQFVKTKNLMSDNVVLYPHVVNRGSIPDALPEHELITSHSTITTAIHLAAYMGAKNIILVGHDCGILDGECNFQGYHEGSPYTHNPKWYAGWLKIIESQTIKLRRLLKEKFGCNIVSLNPFVNLGLEGHSYTK